ncbi:DUF2268 domain-containing protein [Dyadobacter sp. CY345]|uniref:gliding motility protein GldB-related protein n=1 Tax=Dyadobacter sp. CY345 TaxID=2909335 RepID=UPI001F355B71|nr:DUF2268 domain-containing putative Zn-dependent protease [Dyadobacter sp. CY345]MCF2447674.1 DUF2268 domain-containing protein [Dyadobacter sp. CY345]
MLLLFRLSFFLILATFTTRGYCQKYEADAVQYKKLADSLGKAKSHRMAASAYVMEAKFRRMDAFKRQANVDAAYHYVQANLVDSGMIYMENAVRKYGYRSNGWIDSDPAMAGLKNHRSYAALQKFILEKKKNEEDPENAALITSDIELFWKVYDRYKLDTANAENRFLTEYFEKGTVALQEYFRIKMPNIGGIKGFVQNMRTMPAYYKSIRENTLKTQFLKDSIQIVFRKLKSWYPPSTFPNTTFVIGGWSSGGTVTEEYGALVGTDMQSSDENTVLTELNPWQKGNQIPFKEMNHVVAHELIHVQQTQMEADTTLLSYVLGEGMADFLGELISGKTANHRLHVWAKGREKAIWSDFKKEIYLDRYSNWIANSSQETPDHPADLGYWVGYQICKAYFDQSKDKKQAVFDMLNIKDYKKFYAESKVEEMITAIK